MRIPWSKGSIQIGESKQSERCCVLLSRIEAAIPTEMPSLNKRDEDDTQLYLHGGVSNYIYQTLRPNLLAMTSLKVSCRLQRQTKFIDYELDFKDMKMWGVANAVFLVPIAITGIVLDAIYPGPHIGYFLGGFVLAASLLVMPALVPVYLSLRSRAVRNRITKAVT